jgi:hypothetical protein
LQNTVLEKVECTVGNSSFRIGSLINIPPDSNEFSFWYHILNGQKKKDFPVSSLYLIEDIQGLRQNLTLYEAREFAF